MKRRIVAMLSALAMLVVMFTGCSAGKQKISSAEELNSAGVKIGTVQGTAAMYITEEKLPKAEIKYYQNVADCYTALVSDQLDAMVYSRCILENYAETDNKIALIDGNVGYAEICAGLKLGNTELKAKVDEFIAQAKADGTLADMEKRWIGVKDPVMPEIEMPANPVGTLRVATEGLDIPFTYFGDNGVLMGYDIEFAKRLAAYLNMDVSIESMSFDALFPTLNSDKADIVVNQLNVTDERKQSVMFSEPYYRSEIVVAVNKDRYEQSEKKFAALSDFSGETITLPTGSALDRIVSKAIGSVKFSYTKDNSAAIESVRSGKAAAVVLDKPVAFKAAAANSELMPFPIAVETDDYAYLFPKGSDLVEKFNSALKELRESGKLAELEDYWINNPVENPVVEPQKSTGKNGTVKVTVEDDVEPMSYINGEGEVIGYDIAVCNLICDKLDIKAEYVPTSADSVVENIKSGKTDFAVGPFSITEERKQSVDFCDTTYSGAVTLLVRKDRVASELLSGSTLKEELSGKKVGIMTGSAAVMSVENEYPDAEVIEINSISDAVEMLKAGKLDYVLSSRSTCLNFAKYNKGLRVIDEEVISGDKTAAYIAINKENPELLDKINSILKRYSEDGTLAAIEKNWLGENAAYDMSGVPKKADAPVLKVGIDVSDEPMEFVLNGKNAGFDCELIERIAYELGMRVEYSNMNFPALIPALQSGKVDVVISDITATDERREMVNFTEPYYANPQVLLTRKTDEEIFAEKSGWEQFWSNFKDSFTRTFITENRWKLVLNGLAVTLIISICAFIVGSIWGGVICALLRSKRKIANIPAKVYVRLLQGTPIVVLLMILYYIVFKDFDISAIVVAIIGFALNLGAYTSQIFKTAIDSVDKGQIEAASAMGFNKFQVFMKIIFPQAARNALPVYKGEFISLVKSTSIVGYIAIQDLTKVSDIIRSRTYEAFFPLIATAIIYFVVTYIFIILLNVLEKKIDPKRRKRVVKGVDEK